MTTNPTVSELRKAAHVTDQEIDAAVDAYLANPRADPFRFASGNEIDVAAAVNGHQPSKAAIHDQDRPTKFKRTMVRTAILLAHPAKE